MPRDLVLAGAEQPGQRHDLAPPQRERHAAHTLPPSRARRAASATSPGVRAGRDVALRLCAPIIASVSRASVQPARSVVATHAAVAQHRRHVAERRAPRRSGARRRGSRRPAPSAARSPRRAARASRCPSDAVGSSRIRSSRVGASALAISTICRSASDRPTHRRLRRDVEARAAPAPRAPAPRIAARSSRPPRRGSRPSARFSRHRQIAAAGSAPGRPWRCRATARGAASPIVTGSPPTRIVAGVRRVACRREC